MSGGGWTCGSIRSIDVFEAIDRRFEAIEHRFDSLRRVMTTTMVSGFVALAGLIIAQA